MSKKQNPKNADKTNGTNFPRLATADPDVVPLTEMDKEKKAAAKKGKARR